MNLNINLNKDKIYNKNVFLRADLNVPIHNQEIINDFRLTSLQPTLNFLVENKAKITLGTHLGKSIGKENFYSTNFNSTKLLVNWFKKKNYEIFFESDLKKAYLKSLELKGGEILLLENLRFFEGEESKIPEVRELFAKELFNFGSFYINDGWGILHKNSSSITNLPKLYSFCDKSIGFLIEKEIINLKKLNNYKILFILGGSKVKTKLPIIEKLLNNSSAILLCPALVFTFLKAIEKRTGNSLIDESQISNAKKILELISQKNIPLIFPIDYYVTKNIDSNCLTYENNDEISNKDIGITVGPKTINNFIQEINKAKAIFLNGPMGLDTIAQSMEPFKRLLQAVAQSTAFKVVGGGDSVAAVYRYGLEGHINFCSSGGGSTLAFLAGQQLPGLEALTT